VVETLTQAVPQASSKARTRAQAPRRRFLPVLPTLRPTLLAPRLRLGPAPYPFACTDVRSYYFARNGVWEAARLLKLQGAEVLVPAYHHGVEVEALVAAGVRPTFVRVDAGMQIDLAQLEASIGPDTKAIYVIHYLGFAQPMEAILDLARRRDLAVIEDCALALLSKDGLVPLGARGDVGIFCLYKSLPVPNGGMLVLNRPLDAPWAGRKAPLGSTLSYVAGGLAAHLALRYGQPGEAVRDGMRKAVRAVRGATGLRALSTGTMHFDPTAVDVDMSKVSALILENLDYDAIVAARRRNWSLLHARLRELSAPVQDALPSGICPLFYPLLCDDKAAVAARLALRGVETVEFWNTGHPACPVDAFPEVAALRRRVLELPLHQDLTPEDMAYLAAAVEEALS
jgi:dTDP-4-amino-4,6-dideoxygalactose transaminase